MFAIGNLIFAVAKVLDIVLLVYYWLILARAILSWVSPDPFNPIVQFLHRTTDFVLDPIRRLLPPMGFDLSPIIAFLIIVFIKEFLVRSLFQLGARLQ